MKREFEFELQFRLLLEARERRSVLRASGSRRMSSVELASAMRTNEQRVRARGARS